MYESNPESMLRHFQRLRLITIPLVMLVACHILLLVIGRLAASRQEVSASTDTPDQREAAGLEHPGGSWHVMPAMDVKDAQDTEAVVAAAGYSTGSTGEEVDPRIEDVTEELPSAAVRRSFAAIVRGTESTMKSLFPTDAAFKAIRNAALEHDWMSAAQSAVSGAGEAPEPELEDFISLKNEGPIPVSFLWDDEVITLEAGEVRFVEKVLSATIRFHRGGGFGKAKVLVETGDYRFGVGNAGWELNRVE